MTKDPQHLPSNAVTREVRAGTEAAEGAGRAARGVVRIDPLVDILVVDLETTTDPRQSLTFGGWIHGKVGEDGRVSRISEGLIYADDLPETDPQGFEALRHYARSNLADVDRR